MAKPVIQSLWKIGKGGANVVMVLHVYIGPNDHLRLCLSLVRFFSSLSGTGTRFYLYHYPVSLSVGCRWRCVCVHRIGIGWGFVRKCG